MVMEFAYNDILENVQVNNIILAAAGDGVISGLDVSERGAGVNMSVDVATGSVIIGGTTYTESSIVNLAISTADATHARKDLVIYDVATTNPLVVIGTPATPPLPPDITAGDILLAIVNVAANETVITNSEITDGIVGVVTGGSLDGLSNVVITSVADNEGLAWDTSSSKWINQTPAEAGVAALAGFTMTGNVAMGTNKITGLGAATTNGDAVRYEQPLLKTGGTMAGAINMGDYQINGVDDIKAYDTNGIKILNSAGAEKLRVGTTIYALVANANFDMNSSRIESLADPSSAQDAATKNWIETSAVAYNAGKVDGCDAGLLNGNVFKISSNTRGSVLYFTTTGLVVFPPGIDNYQLTTHGAGNSPSWSAASDLIFSDTHCPKCGQEFQDGDDLILHVIGHNEVGDILTLPMHLSCANQPKKTVTLKRKVFEDIQLLDEMTGELVVQRVQKMAERTVTKHKLKEGHIIDGVTGKAHTVNDNGTRGEALHHLVDAIEDMEETIEEVVYENVDFEL